MMPPARKRKLCLLLLVLAGLAVTSALVLYALRQNINLFHTPSDIQAGRVPAGQRIRVGGMVVKDSLTRRKDSLHVAFALTDMQHTIHVHYEGILPDLFREGQGIVATGTVSPEKDFIATQVLAKHDEKYMPPEIRDMMPKPAGDARR